MFSANQSWEITIEMTVEVEVAETMKILLVKSMLVTFQGMSVKMI